MPRSALCAVRVSGSTTTLGLALLVCTACGGGEVRSDPPPVCYASHPLPDGGSVRNLSAGEWADLVVRSYRAGTTSTHDCVGSAIQWRPTDPECTVHDDEEEAPPEARPITEASVVVGRSDRAMVKPVWVITHAFADGDGFGPVAVTERTAEGVAVRALGTLRMPIQRARLRLRETGGQTIVVADGERCPREDEGGESDAAESADGSDAESPCLRYARLLPVVGDRLLTSQVRSSRENECLGPAQVWLARRHTVALQNGWERTFELAASMEYRAGAVIVHEQVTATDRDPRDPGRPGRRFRTSSDDQVIFIRRGGLESEGVPLFERAIRAGGSTQLPIAEAGEDEEHSASGRGSPAARDAAAR